MRKAFHQYFQPTDSDLKEVWESGIVAYDASVLLNLYGYSDETRDSLVALIEKRSTYTRQPHQFALEYARGRSGTILRQFANYQSAQKALEDVRSSIVGKNNHPFLSDDSLKHYDHILAELRDRGHAMERLVGTDPYAERLLRAFDGRIGPQPTPQALVNLHAEAQRRYDQKIPPGYEDIGQKPSVDAFGDYVGWQQLMDIAAEAKKPTILVVDDMKSDWWLRQGKNKDRTIGPEPRLREEFLRATGQQVFMYTSENFLRSAVVHQVATIPQNVISEVAARLEGQIEARFHGEKQEFSSSTVTEKAEAPSDTSLDKRTSSEETTKSSDLTKGG